MEREIVTLRLELTAQKVDHVEKIARRFGWTPAEFIQNLIDRDYARERHRLGTTWKPTPAVPKNNNPNAPIRQKLHRALQHRDPVRLETLAEEIGEKSESIRRTVHRYRDEFKIHESCVSLRWPSAPSVQ